MSRTMQWLAVAIGLQVAACNPMANLDGAEAKIERFQAVYSSGGPDELYEMTGEAFREASTREEFADMVELFDARLGPIVESERSGFNLNTNNGITRTVVTMETEFAQGAGMETYTFHGHGEDIELIGWHVNSPRLALTMDDLKKLNEAESAQTDVSAQAVVSVE